MPSAGRAAAGLLLCLAPRSWALRTPSRDQPDAGKVPGEQDTVFGRQTERFHRTHTFHSFREDIKRKLGAVDGPIATLTSSNDKHAAVGEGAGDGAGEDAFGEIPGCMLATSPDACSIKERPRAERYSVYPGGDTRCIFGGDYKFMVIPGDSDKLLLHFDGGGACWDEMTTVDLTACVTEAGLPPWVGAYNKFTEVTEGKPNPFEGYTAVLIPHCSGDLHTGSVRRSFRNKVDADTPVEQRGYNNARAVIDWVKANIAPKLSHFAISGESAGAIGLGAWGKTLLSEFQYERATLLADSYVGIFPDGFQGPVFHDLGACETGLLKGKQLEMCRNNETTVSGLFRDVINEFAGSPNVLFGSFNSKHDVVQTAFYNTAAGSMRVKKALAYCGPVDINECDLNGAPAEVMEDIPLLEDTEYHRRMEEVVEQYGQNSNYVSYLMSGGSHTMQAFAFGRVPLLDYSQVQGGWLGGADGEQRQSAQQWLRDFYGPSAAKGSHCERMLQDEDDWCREAQELKSVKHTF